eukprot:333778-Hanusia_phi.AAC.5
MRHCPIIPARVSAVTIAVYRRYLGTTWQGGFGGLTAGTLRQAGHRGAGRARTVSGRAVPRRPAGSSSPIIGP